MESFLLSYNIIYFSLSFFVLIYALTKRKSESINIYDSFITFLFLVILAILIGLRDFNIGTDTPNYLRDFYFIKSTSSLGAALDYIRNGNDPLFTTLTYYISRFFSERGYLLVLAFLFILPIKIFIFNVTVSYRSFLLLAFYSLYSFKYLGINTVRSGLAIGSSLLVLHYLWNSKENKKALLVAIFATVLHVSAGAFALAALIVHRVKKPHWFYLLFFITSVLAILGFGINNIPIIGDVIMQYERFNAYFDGDDEYKTGFSYTYWVYNLLVLLYGWFFLKKIDSIFYTRLVSLFALLSSVYFMCFNLIYNDRVGIFSWILIPILLTYPFAKGKFMQENAKSVVLIFILMLFQLMAIFYLKR